MSMTEERWRDTASYLDEVFGAQDSHLAGLMDEALAGGLPDIAVNAAIGRLLMIMASMTRGRLAVEVGTLAGYSGIWIARGLAPGGRLVTIEREATHAAFAHEQFRKAGVENRIEIRLGSALEVLSALAAELPAASVDFVFIDAAKEEYPQYLEHLRPLVAPGGVLMADNALGSDSWWIDDDGHPQREAADKFNRMLAKDPDFEAVVVPVRQGVMIARRNG